MIRQNPHKIVDVAERFVKDLQADTDEEFDAVGTVAIVVEARDYGDEPGEGRSAFLLYCTDSRRWVQEALLAEAQDTVADNRWAEENEDDD